ncbi:DUF721 domain-containing protein [Mangrovivirga cuniculi]|uniref:DUF721 domain-containing protein n=1 Tax=Mangrovivirga cuniculi TaxID=2715131 RepID=A0A4D7JCY1_9BACT|nr:DUF721 domain-containing protein [Mangrovivirga cuniculi]QCK13531.1 DUF721 domain-containing protein [Mangrovivirga cuniculi]
MAGYNKKGSKRNAGISTLKDSIQEMFKEFKLDAKYKETELIKSWPELMGPMIAKRTTKVFIKDKKMFVKLNSAPLKRELSMSRSKILALFHQKFGEILIEDIVFL